MFLQKANPPGVRTHDHLHACQPHYPLRHAHTEHATVCGTYTQRVHSQFSNALLRGWTRESVKTADAIVFGVRNCSTRDSRRRCHSITFLRKPRKTPFSGHFSKNFQPPLAPEICIFLQKVAGQTLLSNGQATISVMSIFEISKFEPEDCIILIV